MHTKNYRNDARTVPKRSSLAKSLLAGGILLFSAAANADIIFQEDFNSSLGQFTASGSVTTGTYGARMAAAYGSGDAFITSAPISTVGFTNISLTWTRTTSGLDSGESGIAMFSTNGSTWTTIESVQSASGVRTVALPAGAAGQSALRLRFEVDGSLSSETYTVDTIRLEGTGSGGGCEPNCEPPPTGNPYERGPAPTTSSLEASTGPFQVATTTVSSTTADGYGSGTIYHPTGVTGPFAAIAICPGYTATQTSISQWGPRLASHGFVVITINTNSTSDQPPSRATQLMAALDQLVTFSNTSGHAIFGKVDGTRRGVMGHSMGGGGSLIAARDNPSLKAAIPMAPWYSSSTNFSAIRTPTMIVACESDSIARVSSHALPFYNSIPSTTPKAFAERNNGSHNCPINNNDWWPTLNKYGVAWMKRFLDNDTRYSPWLCGAPHEAVVDGTTYSRYLSNCPY